MRPSALLAIAVFGLMTGSAAADVADSAANGFSSGLTEQFTRLKNFVEKGDPAPK